MEMKENEVKKDTDDVMEMKENEVRKNKNDVIDMKENAVKKNPDVYQEEEETKEILLGSGTNVYNI